MENKYTTIRITKDFKKQLSKYKTEFYKLLYENISDEFINSITMQQFLNDAIKHAIECIKKRKGE